jgi:hypothetical protein
VQNQTAETRRITRMSRKNRAILGLHSHDVSILSPVPFLYQEETVPQQANGRKQKLAIYPSSYNAGTTRRPGTHTEQEPWACIDDTHKWIVYNVAATSSLTKRGVQNHEQRHAWSCHQRSL